MLTRPQIFLEDESPWLCEINVASKFCVHGRGYAFVNGQYYCRQYFASMIADCCKSESRDKAVFNLKKLIPNLNGCWALVVQWGDGHTFAAVDRSRSVPVFYTASAIASRPEFLASGCLKVDTVSAIHFLLSGYTSGCHTIFRGISQIEAGQWIEFVPGRAVMMHPYFRCFPEHRRHSNAAQLSAELEDRLESIFARHARALCNRRLVLPLSGGYDSRLVGWMLRKHGVRDVLCYTYGVSESAQVQIAKRVADALGFRWVFVPYSAKKWADAMAMPEMREYWRYASRGTSSPHIQDFPAIVELHRRGELRDSPVFLPGHVGDAWACEFMVQRLEEPTNHPPSEYHSPYRHIRNPVVSAVIYRHLNLWPVAAKAWNRPPFSDLVDHLEREVQGYHNERDGGVWAFVEWVLRSRTANWIVNSGRAVEFFGGEFALCLGDYELIDFFRELPLEHLYGRRLYADTMAQRVFKRPDCPLSKIEVLSGGTRVSGAKAALVRALVGLRLYKPLDRLRKREYRSKSLASDCWFTSGKLSTEVTVGEAVCPHLVSSSMPAELFGIVKPFYTKPAYSIQCNGLLTANVLAAYQHMARHSFRGLLMDKLGLEDA